MRKTLSFVLTFAFVLAILGGCANSAGESTPSPAASETAATEETVTETAAIETDNAETATAEETGNDDDVTIRVGSLKGPTSMGLVHLMGEAENGNAAANYEFTMVTAADELLGEVVSGNVDIALVPANVASVLYNRTEGGVSVIDINTLGVLYIVSADDSIQSFADLKGRTICLTGKGSTPEYTMNYLLAANGLSTDDVTLEYKYEAAEVVATLAEQPDAVGMLPQPFVTVACAQNESLQIVLDCTAEWEAVQGESGSRLVTGVTIVRNEFLEAHKDLVDLFLNEHFVSTQYTETNPEESAELIASAGIIEKAAVAQKALPYCNIVCITGEEMQTALSGYLEVLYDQEPASVGGTLPGDDFYYLP